MCNMIDYLSWRGNLPICSEVPFCAVDSMILARCSYLRFDLISLYPEYSFSDALDQLSALDPDVFFNENDPLLIECLRKSRRFSNIPISDYTVCREPEKAEQFAAIVFHLPYNELYLSFIGTDDTLYGLREDFNLAYLPSIPSQEHGLKYVREILAKYPSATLRLGGHSKGGNVAQFAAYHLETEERKRLISAESFDGPGFDESLTPLHEPEDLLPKLISYLPEDSIIGRMLHHRDEICIVKSRDNGISQHNLYNWEVLGDNFVSAEHFESSSDVIHDTLSELTDQCPPEQRRAFFEGLYGMIASSNTDNTGKLAKNWYRNFPELFSSYRDIPEEDRKTALSVLAVLQKSTFSALKNETAQQLARTKEAMREIFGKKAENE